MSHLFSRTVINDAIKEIDIPDQDGKISILKEWLDMYQSGALQKKSEMEFEAVYSEKLFGTILGYTGASASEYTREKQPRNVSNGQKPDIGLGYYSDGKSTTKAIVELKDAATSLDRPQQRAGNLTPVQQAFKYKPLYNCRWVIVSNFYELRLYTDTYQDYESFTLTQLADPKDDYKNFRKFYVLFHVDTLISKTGESKTGKLLAKVRIEEEAISKKFYQEYKELRTELMRDIWKNNPEFQNASVIEKAQRIIDRVVFIHFCEDIGLLPNWKLGEVIEYGRRSLNTIWQTLTNFFHAVDGGSPKLGIPEGYNGGLFRQDDSIDTLKIDDEIIEKFVNLGRYDFSEDGGELSVEILGHIFEQSISDIEELRSKIEAGEMGEEKTENKISKRKKDGIFYTPAYIVDYIVRNSLGRHLEEHEERLKEQYDLKADITEKNYRKREIEAYTEYQKVLHSVKVLDPACGSGAFLVRVFDFLMEENKRVANILSEGEQVSLFQSETYFKEILQNNIYGVDLNEESVEITKLSLWLKTAQKGKKLATLDRNIKCGNSLIDDPAVAGDKAFDWNREFPEIMASGGFDVIVGNPPYVQLSKITTTTQAEKNYLINRFWTSWGRLNTYIFFIHLANDLLNEKWKMGYIIPNTLLTQDYYKETRELLVKSTLKLSEIVLYSGMEFVDAVVETMTILANKWSFIDCFTIKKQENPENIKKMNDINFDDIRNNSMFLINPNRDNLSEKVLLKWHWTIDQYFNINQAIALKWDKSLSVFRDSHPEFKKLIDGKHIQKYVLRWWGDYLDYSIDRIHSCKSTEIFTQPKIIFRRVSGTLVATYDENNFFALNTLVVITPKASLDLKYLLCVFNSKLLNYCYVNTFKSSKTVFSEIQARSVWKLPIPNIPFPEQQPFIEKADQMLTLNKELHEKSEAFLKNISTKFGIEKVSKKLEKWYELDFESFVKELKVKLGLEAQEELMGYFEKRASEVREIAAKIEATDREIDEMVFELYGLSEEERMVILVN